MFSQQLTLKTFLIEVPQHATLPWLSGTILDAREGGECALCLACRDRQRAQESKKHAHVWQALAFLRHIESLSWGFAAGTFPQRALQQDSSASRQLRLRTDLPQSASAATAMTSSFLMRSPLKAEVSPVWTVVTVEEGPLSVHCFSWTESPLKETVHLRKIRIFLTSFK